MDGSVLSVPSVPFDHSSSTMCMRWTVYRLLINQGRERIIVGGTGEVSEPFGEEAMRLAKEDLFAGNKKHCQQAGADGRHYVPEDV